MNNKKFLKTAGIFLLILNLILFNNFSMNYSFASNFVYTEPISIKTEIISDETVNYAKSIYTKHLLSLIDANEINGDLNEFSLGNSFNLYNVKTKTHSSCFTIIYKKSIVAILEVYKDNNEFSSSLSKSFSDELNTLLTYNTQNIGNFFLLTDGVNLQAFDGVNSVKIYELYENENSEDLGKLFTKNTKIQNKVNHSKLIEPIKSSDSLGISTVARPILQHQNSILDLNHVTTTSLIEPFEGKTINVRGVSQGNHPWCWAATTAAMINFYKGYSLKASNIAKYVFPKNPEQGGDWTDMKKAYNHWGLYPKQTGIIGFNSVMYNINKNKPMHLGLKGHSVGLIGYRKWIDEYGGSRVLVLLEPNGGVRKSVTLKSNNNFNYQLGGGTNAWIYTREF